MTYEEFEEKNNALIKQICTLRSEQAKLKARYIEENTPLKIGDKIRVGNDEGVVSEVEMRGGGFFFFWRKYKKNGELSLVSQRIKGITSIKKL